jgi:hypothetical protein
MSGFLFVIPCFHPRSALLIQHDLAPGKPAACA